MENNNLSDQLVDDFVMGLLEEEESQKIRKLLEKDSSLAEQVKLRSEMIFGLEALGRKSLKDELKNIHQEVIGETKAPAKRRSLFPYIAVAASLLILMVALAWLLRGEGTINTKDLYAANFEQYDLSLKQRDGAEEKIIQIEELYKAGKYKEVLPLLEAELATDESRASNLLLATGITHLELNAPDKALFYFKQITGKGDFNFEDEVTWYSALVYLKSGNLDATKNQLKILTAKPKADHYQEAKKLLNKLGD